MSPQTKTSHQEKETFDRPVISWTAPEFVKHRKGRLWFMIAGLIIVAVVVYSVFIGSWSTAVVFIMLTGVYFLQHRLEPKDVEVTVSEIGIKVDDKFFTYSNIRYFWIVYDPPFVKTLNFETVNRLFPQITVQLGDLNPALIRNYLVQQIPEIEGKEENFVDILTRIFKL